MLDLESLNTKQQEAVHHEEGPLLVLAGAGSGKTRIVTFRIAHLLQKGVAPHQILAMTFTNKAAEEMRHRILHLTQRSILACTFHSLCARILRESISALGFSRHFTIYDDEDSMKVLKEVFALLQLKCEKGDVKKIRSEISQAKNQFLLPDQVEDEEIRQIYAAYQTKLKEYNALDFDDLLFLTVLLFQKHPDILKQYQERWKYISIDEYQDTNMAQYLLVQLLAKEHQNVFAVGDPDQSIYSWRGANIHNILNFASDFSHAKIIPLEQNYRSKSNILKAANALITHNTSRYEKNLWSALGEGERIGIYLAANDHEEAEFVIRQIFELHFEKRIPLKECVIFYRTHFQSRLFEDFLLKQKIPYVIVGGFSFYQRKEIKDVLSLLRIVVSGQDHVAFFRTINLPKRGLGEATLLRLRDLSVERGCTLFETCEKVIENHFPFKLSQKQREGLGDYIQVIHSLQEMSRQNRPLHEIIVEAIDRWRYLTFLKEDPDTYEERRGNLEELIAKAAEWQEEVEEASLVHFLEELTLKSNTEAKEVPEDQIRMMTLHNGKGLEFTAAFIVGMEEELLPHLNSLEDEEALEEERRLCYVGMTRAKEYLFLSASRYRFLWGMPRVMRLSRFLKEVPPALLRSMGGEEDLEDF